MKSPIVLIPLAYSGVALASYFAVRSFAGALEEMKTVGGGIAAITLGAGQAARVPLIAAWITAGATAVAIILVGLALRRSVAGAGTDDAAASRLLWPAGLALMVGIASVLLFRGVIEYVLAAAIPSAPPRSVDATSMAEAFASRITFASIAIALCFAVAAVLFIRELRLSRGAPPSGAALRVTAAALVVSLGVSTALAITLQSYSRGHLEVALRGAPVSTVLP